MIPILLLSVLLGLAACGSPADDAAVRGAPVKLALNWFPEAEHGGYYAAQVHGLYRDRGVQVEILGGGPDAPVVQRVATGQVAFGLTNADGVINARAAGAPIVALFAPYQVNPRCIVVHESTGFTSVEQLTDVTLALSQRPAFSQYLRHRFPLKGVAIVPYQGGMAPFLENERYAMQGYVFSEPVVARRQGARPRALMVADTGFNPYASALIATEETVAQRPDLVAAVVAASRAGWARYLEAPDSTHRRIHELNPEMDLEILGEGARLSRDLVLDPVAREHGIGYMELARWAALLEQMVASGVVDAGQVRPEDCFTDRFLPAAP